MASGRVDGKPPTNQTWWIPLSYAQPGGNFNDTKPKKWMTPEEESVEIDGLPEGDKPVIFNVQQKGFNIISIYL